MLVEGPWKAKSNGLYLRQWGDMRLVVENTGTDFRVLVTRAIDENQPGEVLYSGSAANENDAMAIAQRVADQVFVYICPGTVTPAPFD
jgi:hypothetical protein